MKTVDEVKDYLCEHGYEETIVFENPGFPEAFIGVSEDGRAVYDFEKMCESLMDEWGGAEYTDAVEFIEYNTIRALPYMGEMAPVVMYPVMD